MGNSSIMSLPYSASMYALTNPALAEDAKNRLLAAQASLAETQANDAFWAHDPVFNKKLGEAKVAQNLPLAEFAREQAVPDAMAKTDAQVASYNHPGMWDIRDNERRAAESLATIKDLLPAQTKAQGDIQSAIIKRSGDIGVAQENGAAERDSRLYGALGQVGQFNSKAVLPSLLALLNQAPGGQSGLTGPLGSKSPEEIQSYLEYRSKDGVSPDRAMTELRQHLGLQ